MRKNLLIFTGSPRKESISALLASADRAGEVGKNRKVIKEAYQLGKKLVS
ncbi:MAG: hypothetical protein PHQ25_03405 [Acidobacteriota bacterium]|nr:hypothetical protein [Acidobacteriota bacterium]